MPKLKVALSNAAKRARKQHAKKAAAAAERKKVLAILADAQKRAVAAEKVVAKLAAEKESPRRLILEEESSAESESSFKTQDLGESPKELDEVGEYEFPIGGGKSKNNYQNPPIVTKLTTSEGNSANEPVYLDTDPIPVPAADLDSLRKKIVSQEAEMAVFAKRNAELQARLDSVETALAEKDTLEPEFEVCTNSENSSISKVLNLPKPIELPRRVAFTTPITPMGAKTTETPVPFAPSLPVQDLNPGTSGEIPDFLKMFRRHYTLAANDAKGAEEARKLKTVGIDKPNDNGQLKRFISSIDHKRFAGWPPGSEHNVTFLYQLVTSEGIAATVQKYLDLPIA